MEISVNYINILIMNKINLSSLKKTLTKKEMKNITGGSGSNTICCRTDGAPGCDYTFTSDTCDGHKDTCAKYSTSGFYTCY